jgi:predicted nucleic acid-binding protein
MFKIFKKKEQEEMHEVRVAILDLHLKAYNFAKVTLEIVKLFQNKQLSRKKVIKELTDHCLNFMTKLDQIHGK